jgi:hypothetical protein
MTLQIGMLGLEGGNGCRAVQRFQSNKVGRFLSFLSPFTPIIGSFSILSRPLHSVFGPLFRIVRRPLRRMSRSPTRFLLLDRYVNGRLDWKVLCWNGRRCRYLVTAHAGPQNDQFRLILISRSSARILVERNSLPVSGSEVTLPLLFIPKWTRWAPHIQQAIRQRWNLRSVVLDTLGGLSRREYIAIAEAIDVEAPGPLFDQCVWIPLEELPGLEIEIEDSERSLHTVIRELLDGKKNPHEPFLQLGWTDELLRWIATVVPTDRIDVDNGIEQFNASSSHALVKIRRRHGPALWFKAVAEPVLGAAGHEYVATTILSKLFPEYLPGLLASRQDWNGWLMNDAGLPIEESDLLDSGTAKLIGRRLAEMQQASVPHVNELLRHRFIDQRIPALQEAMVVMMPYLEDAMRSQRAAGIPALRTGRLKEIAGIFKDVCFDLEEASIPDTVIHNVLNSGNILIGKGTCVFTDWAQAGVGNPLVALDQLQQYWGQNQRLSSWLPFIVRSYREQWRSRITDVKFNRALRSIRLLSIVTHLASRRHWFMFQYRHQPGLESYIRSLLRQMDNAAQSVRYKEFSEPAWGNLSA